MDSKKEFLVKLSAPASVHFLDGDCLFIRNFPSEFGKLHIAIQTGVRQDKGLNTLIREGLVAYAGCSASSLGESVGVIGNTTRAFGGLLSLVTNAYVGDFTAEFAYEISEGTASREFWLSAKQQCEIANLPTRPVRSEQLTDIFGRIMFHDDRDRLLRAVGQYHEALKAWLPGMEIAVLSHLWMGMEALTPVVKRMLMKRMDMEESQLSEYLVAEERKVTGQRNVRPDIKPLIRRQYLFQGDVATYHQARQASDGYEHGFLQIWEVRELAITTVRKTADYLRNWIIELVLSKEEAGILLSARDFEIPYNAYLTPTISGSITGEVQALNLIEGFPNIGFTQELAPGPIDCDGVMQPGTKLVFRHNLPEGVSYRHDQPGFEATMETLESLERSYDLCNERMDSTSPEALNESESQPDFEAKG